MKMQSNQNFYIASGDAEWCGHSEKSLIVSYKVKYLPTCDPEIPLPGILLLGEIKLFFTQKRTLMFTAALCMITKHQKKPMSFSKGMSKPTMLSPSGEILLSQKKQKTIDQFSNMNKMERHYAEQNKPLLKGYIPDVSIHMTFSE